VQPLIIAAPASGCGKSSVTIGLLAALQQRGLTVAPFKIGPDFIDPGHHAAVCGRVSRNLDGWMCGYDGVMHSFAAGRDAADLAVVEGVMGLFDGADGASDAGSTAEIARWLGGRILLVVDARAQARSAAAIVHGLTTFAPDLDFAGVLYNRVGSTNHERLLREAHASAPHLPPLLGCLPRRDTVALPERHLGLVTAGEAFAATTYAQLAEWVAGHVDLEQLLSGLAGPAQAAPMRPATAPAPPARELVRIGVARDAAFCFCYPENLELLERAGAELVGFSPLTDPLPEHLGGLYLPGGYPELYGERLGANAGLLASLRRAAQAGLPIYAECGGLLYLTQGVAPVGTASGEAEGHPARLAALFPAGARMLSRRKALGYREVTFTATTPLGPAGTVARGHEFHYSELAMPDSVPRSYLVFDRAGKPCAREGYLYQNILGSYIHLHFASNPQLAEHFVHSCRQWRQAVH
jgi:cobyrinic acid a,c-diamide synthase